MRASVDVPRCWVGSTVAVALMEAVSTTGRPILCPAFKSGVLEAVTDLGIYGDFRDCDRDDEPEVSIFYPWSSVLGITPAG